MGAIVRSGADLSWFTETLQDELLEALSTGLKPSWVALFCGVAPKAIGSILDLGSRKDAVEPFKGFVRRWTHVEAKLMHGKVIEWRDGSSTALVFLKERWPNVWGPDAEDDYAPLAPSTSTAEEMSQLDMLIADPAAFGPEVFAMFEKHGRLRADGT
jgi:hypothetical protein